MPMSWNRNSSSSESASWNPNSSSINFIFSSVALATNPRWLDSSMGRAAVSCRNPKMRAWILLVVLCSVRTIWNYLKNYPKSTMFHTLSLTPDDFTLQGESASTEWVKPQDLIWSRHVWWGGGGGGHISSRHVWFSKSSQVDKCNSITVFFCEEG
jgi:hypothetical protein